MTRKLFIALSLALYAFAPAGAAPATDTLGRESPQSSVTGFLEACRSRDYDRASQYLDLNQIPAAYRQREGADLARKLEAILNSDPDFNIGDDFRGR